MLAGWSLVLRFRAAAGSRRGCRVAQVDRNPKFNISEQKSHSAAARAYRKWQCLVIAISVRLDVSLNLQDFLADRHFVFKQKSCVNRTILQNVWHLGLLTSTRDPNAIVADDFGGSNRIRTRYPAASCSESSQGWPCPAVSGPVVANSFNTSFGRASTILLLRPGASEKRYRFSLVNPLVISVHAGVLGISTNSGLGTERKNIKIKSLGYRA